MPTQKIDPKVIFASDAPAIDKPPVFSDKTKGWDVARANDGRPEIKQMNKMQQDTDLKILWLNENAVLPYDASIDYPDGAVTLKDGSFKQLSSGSWVEFLDDFADKDALKRGIANRYDSSLTYNLGERVVLANGDIVKSTIDGNANDPNVNLTGWGFDDNTVESIADLLAIPNPKNGNHVFVKSLQANYTYYADTNQPENGVTVVDKWVMDTKPAYYASWFAQDVSQSTAPQQDALQVGYKYAALKGKPFIIDKGFFVESSLRTSQELSGVQAAVLVESNSTLVFSNTGYLRHIDTAAANYTILSTYNAENFTVIRPKLIGDKDTHLGSTGEWGYGMAVVACRDGVVFEPNISDCWGDGIYIGQEYWNGNGVEIIPKNIKIIRPTIKNVRRNGIALCAADDLFIDAPYIDVVSGVAPEACIDVEPEEAEGALAQSYLKKVVIRDATLLNGRNYGVLEAIFEQRIVDVHFKGTTTISGCETFIAVATNSTTSTDGIVKYDHVCVDHAITGLSKGSLIINSNVNKGFTTTIDQLDLRMYNNHILGVILDADSSVGDGGNFLVNKVNVSRIDNGQPVNKEANFRRSNTGPINYKNLKLPLPDYLQYKSYNNVGVFSMQDNCNIGCFDNLAKATVNYSELFATTNYMTPVDNGGGAIWAQVVGTPIVGREYNIKMLQSVTSIGSGLIIMLPHRTTPNRIESTSFNAGVRVTNINGIEIDSYSGNWSYPA